MSSYLDLSSPWREIVALVGGLIFTRFIMGILRGKKNHFEVNGKTLLLTGASEGMGLSVAKMLAAKGASIVIVARNVSKLEAAIEEVKAAATSPSQRFHYISADISKSSENQRIITETTAWNNDFPPDIIWCMAGASRPKLFLDSTPAENRWHMDVNFFSCVDIAHEILGTWLSPSVLAQRKERHLIFTSSVAAFCGVAGYTPYSPSKAAIRSFSDNLAQEVLLYSDDVKIHTVFPGTILSPGLELESQTKPGITKKLEKDDPVQTPDEVARKSIDGLEKGDYLITVGLLGSAMLSAQYGGSRRNNKVLDTLLTWVTSLVWLFIGPDMERTVRKHGKKHGMTEGYKKA